MPARRALSATEPARARASDRGGPPALDGAELAAIFLGGSIGGLARAALAESLPVRPGQWPWATFIVNLLAAALLGYFVTRLQERLPPADTGGRFSVPACAAPSAPSRR